MAEQTYRIGEAADLLQLKSYVLRFWETEFSQLAPLRTEKGQRLYTESHLTLLRRIKHLLHEQGMTIDGARRVLAAEDRHARGEGRPSTRSESGSVVHEAHAVYESAEGLCPQGCVDADVVRMVRRELLQLRHLLLSQ